MQSIPDPPSQSLPVVGYDDSAIYRFRRERWWLLVAWLAGLAFAEYFIPYCAPPGWPLREDRYVMLMVPIGAILLSITTALPGRVVGWYGLISVFIFLQKQVGDSYFKLDLLYHWSNRRVIATWCLAMFGSWTVCRSCTLLRRLP